MSTMPNPARPTIFPCTEIFLFNRSDQMIRIEEEGTDSPFILWPRCWVSREVRRGTTLIIATWVLGRYSFELSLNELGKSSIERCKLAVPSEVGSSLHWGWDGLAWHHLSGEAIHDFDGALDRRHHRPVASMIRKQRDC